MTDIDRLYKLDNGTDTARWAAARIRELEVKLHRISGVLHGDTLYSYEDIEHMRGLCQTDQALTSKQPNREQYD